MVVNKIKSSRESKVWKREKTKYVSSAISFKTLTKSVKEKGIEGFGIIVPQDQILFLLPSVFLFLLL